MQIQKQSTQPSFKQLKGIMLDGMYRKHSEAQNVQKVVKSIQANQIFEKIFAERDGYIILDKRVTTKNPFSGGVTQFIKNTLSITFKIKQGFFSKLFNTGKPPILFNLINISDSKSDFYEKSFDSNMEENFNHAIKNYNEDDFFNYVTNKRIEKGETFPSSTQKIYTEYSQEQDEYNVNKSSKRNISLMEDIDKFKTKQSISENAPAQTDSIFEYNCNYHKELLQGKDDSLLPAINFAINNEDGTIQNDFIPYAERMANILHYARTERIEEEFFPIYKSLNTVINKLDLVGNILKEIKDSSINTFGKINKNYLENIIKDLELELTDFTLISESKTLEQILSNELKQKLGFTNKLTNMTIENALKHKSLDFEYHKRFPELNLLDTIVNGNIKPLEAFSYLVHITSDEDFGEKFVKEVQTNPRIGNTIKFQIIQKLGGGQEGNLLYSRWLNDEKFGYRKAYSDYYNKFYLNAENLSDLVKQSPNVAPWAFNQKAKKLNIEPTLGILPESFGTLEDFRNLIQEIVKLDKIINTRSYKKKNPDYKSQKYTINLNNRKFEVKKLRGGMSAKAKYQVTPENDATYILKFNEYDVTGNTWRCTQFRENQAMRGDSPYLDAIVDFYLKENNCPNSADIKFFDYKSKAVMYQATIGTKPAFNDSLFRNLHIFNNSAIAKDVNDLGVILNDINEGNFIQDSSGNYILIDTGHAEYLHPFRPMVAGKHISLSNLCGRELT